MKKYVSGFLFFFRLTVITLVGLFYVTIGLEQEQVKQVQAIDTLEYPAFAETENTRIDQEEFTDDAETVVHLVLNQEQVEAKFTEKSYCLVAEDGYLIVYDSEEKAINLFTHMPLTEFPVAEQEKLLMGIWFPTMAEIFSYLESYSS